MIGFNENKTAASWSASSPRGLVNSELHGKFLSKRRTRSAAHGLRRTQDGIR
ncbi:hypothetical protein [uncultured Ruminococcus sp.]|uniref:hypothetical protein n=1 Tax=uncultured Ruminococcus sp. TaxID=165186 RepID=UPI002942025C|nr:hypothetical protein [uncultured Ruminococcus sp.]